MTDSLNNVRAGSAALAGAIEEKVLGFSVAIIDRDLVDGFPNKQKNFTPLGDLVNPAKFGTVLFE